MSQDDVTQIRVGDSPIGIVGLKTVLEDMAEEFEDSPDSEAREELLDRLCKRNYIPEKAREDYGKAFLREFKKFLGKPFEEEAPGGLEIKVLGPGCPRCEATKKNVEEAVTESGLNATIIKVTDTMEIAKHGVFGTPAVIVDGEVKSVGRIPKKEEILSWLK